MGRKLLLAAAALTSVAVGVASYLLLHKPAERSAGPGRLEASTTIPEPRPLASFLLQDHRGEPFDLSRLKGRWTFLFFGYTHCPDVCPTTLATLARLAEGLKEARGERPYQVVFVSVDPQRDSPERLARYVPYFDPDFIGVTGEQDELGRLARQLGVLFVRVDGSEVGSDYLMDHTASVILIDPQARFHAVFSAPHDAAAMLRDISEITGH